MGDVNCLRCKYRHTDNGNCTAVGGFCTAVPAAHCPLLREYLGTELTPQEVLSMKFEWCAMMDALNSIGGGYTRLRELAEADRNHQIVIRPCKIGDTVWAADMEPVIPLHVMADAVYLEGRHGGDYERLSNFGSVVFLSQEEAKEAASHWMK